MKSSCLWQYNIYFITSSFVVWCACKIFFYFQFQFNEQLALQRKMKVAFVVKYIAFVTGLLINMNERKLVIEVSISVPKPYYHFSRKYVRPLRLVTFSYFCCINLIACVQSNIWDEKKKIISFLDHHIWVSTRAENWTMYWVSPWPVFRTIYWVTGNGEGTDLSIFPRTRTMYWPFTDHVLGILDYLRFGSKSKKWHPDFIYAK